MKKVIISVMAGLLCFALNVAAQVPNYVPTNGLVGWWPFNGNANDESGNGNNGAVNGSTLTTDRFGNANKAYNFDGVDDYIEVPNNSTITLLGDMSMSAWMNTNGFNNQNYQTIISKRETYWTWEYAMGLSYHSGIPHNHKMIGSRAIGMGNQEQHWSNSNYNISTWEFWTVVFETGLIKIYKNGLLDYSANFSMVPNPQNSPLLFGRNLLSDFSEQFFGSIDDIGIWNRALTECEIQDLYHAQLGSQSIYAGADQTICKGENVILSASGGSNYQWDNNVVDGQAFAPSQTNNYSVTGTDTLGCTGTDTVLVTVLENSSSTLNETALDSYTLNGQTYTQSGTYTQTIPSVNGCDSIITLNLTLNFTGIAVEETLPLVIYPNPATKQITIDNGNFSSMAGYSIKIENNAGQQVFQSVINQAQFNIDLSTWTGNGVYFVHLIDPLNNTVTVRKIVLE